MMPPAIQSPKARYFEDAHVGMSWRGFPILMTPEAIASFGEAYDPQPLHVDLIAAERGPFGGLIASGWHVAALAMRSFVEAHPFGTTPLIGLGVDELRWKRPVRPRDVIEMRGEVIEVAPFKSKPDRGIVRWKIEAINQRGEVVMSFIANTMVPRRSATGAG